VAGIKRGECPYCFTKSVAFSVSQQWQTVHGNHRVLLRCGSCGEGVIWDFLPGTAADLKQAMGDLERYNTRFLRQWPAADSGEAPKDSPENVANFFQQAVSSLQAGNFDAAGMMFRKTLESATKAMNAEAAGQKLVKRIDQLVETGILTKDLGAWAHEVRLAGNDAAHEENPFSAEEASSLRAFTENFLRYAFTLPAAVARRAGQTA
jgi:Domain of unknown function (DUF4145)